MVSFCTAPEEEATSGAFIDIRVFQISRGNQSGGAGESKTLYIQAVRLATLRNRFLISAVVSSSRLVSMRPDDGTPPVLGLRLWPR